MTTSVSYSTPSYLLITISNFINRELSNPTSLTQLPNTKTICKMQVQHKLGRRSESWQAGGRCLSMMHMNMNLKSKSYPSLHGHRSSITEEHFPLQYRTLPPLNKLEVEKSSSIQKSSSELNLFQASCCYQVIN